MRSMSTLIANVDELVIKEPTISGPVLQAWGDADAQPATIAAARTAAPTRSFPDSQ